jgi:hypothetical protein
MTQTSPESTGSTVVIERAGGKNVPLSGNIFPRSTLDTDAWVWNQSVHPAFGSSGDPPNRQFLELGMRGEDCNEEPKVW